MARVTTRTTTFALLTISGHVLSRRTLAVIRFFSENTPFKTAGARVPIFALVAVPGASYAVILVGEVCSFLTAQALFSHEAVAFFTGLTGVKVFAE